MCPPAWSWPWSLTLALGPSEAPSSFSPPPEAQLAYHSPELQSCDPADFSLSLVGSETLSSGVGLLRYLPWSLPH